jgi:hypothetical protein
MSTSLLIAIVIILIIMVILLKPPFLISFLIAGAAGILGYNYLTKSGGDITNLESFYKNILISLDKKYHKIYTVNIYNILTGIEPVDTFCLVYKGLSNETIDRIANHGMQMTNQIQYVEYLISTDIPVSDKQILKTNLLIWQSLNLNVDWSKFKFKEHLLKTIEIISIMAELLYENVNFNDFKTNIEKLKDQNQKILQEKAEQEFIYDLEKSLSENEITNNYNNQKLILLKSIPSEVLDIVERFNNAKFNDNTKNILLWNNEIKIKPESFKELRNRIDVKKYTLDGNMSSWNINQQTYKTPTRINMNNIHILMGPDNMSVFSNGKKNFILFGTKHEIYDKMDCYDDKNITTSKSIYLPEYLIWLFKYNNKENFDYIQEEPFTVSRKDELKLYADGLMYNIRKTFNDCFGDLQEKPGCKATFPNVRFHSGDLRDFTDNSIMGQIMLLINNIFSWQLIEEGVRKNNQKIITEVLQKVAKIIKVETINNLLELLKDPEIKFIEYTFNDPESRIYKNFNKITDTSIKQNIKTYFINKINIGRLNTILLRNYAFESFLNDMKIYIETGKLNLDNITYMALNKEPVIFNVMNMTLPLFGYVMDSYILSRCFSTFVDGSIMSNIIITAGNAHIRLYTDFLSSIGFNELFKASAKKGYCINIENLKNLDQLKLKN